MVPWAVFGLASYCSPIQFPRQVQEQRQLQKLILEVVLWGKGAQRCMATLSAGLRAWQHPWLRPACDYARNQAVAWLSDGHQAEHCWFPVRAKAPRLGTGPPVLPRGQWPKPPLCCLLVCWSPLTRQHMYPTELEDFVTVLWEERPWLPQHLLTTCDCPGKGSGFGVVFFVCLFLRSPQMPAQMTTAVAPHLLTKNASGLIP